MAHPESQFVRQPAVPVHRELAELNRFLPHLLHDPLALSAAMIVMRKRAKRTSMQRSLSAFLSRLKIDGNRAHDVRSSGSRQNTMVHSVSKACHGTVLEYSTEKVGVDGVSKRRRTRSRQAKLCHPNPD